MKKWLWLLAVVCMLSGGFMIGSGFAEYAKVEKQEKQEKQYWLGRGDVEMVSIKDPEQKDEWNRLLLENRQFMTIERELFVSQGDTTCEARIANAQESSLSCTVTIIRDSTSEVLYQSKIIDPGYYIETIQLESALREGWYPCTIIWSFYEIEEDDIIGEMVEKAVVVVRE